MRFKKGSKVEVLSKNEVPSGSWCCAEIICGNGHYYTIKYEMDPGATHEAIIERVSRKLIRPCPPLVELSQNWVAGEVVEVFQNFSWKMATVCKILGRNYFSVRLLGSSHEYKISKSHIRVRLSWEDDRWFVIGKGLCNSEDGKWNGWSNLKYNHKLSSQVKKTNTRMNFHVKDEDCTAKHNLNFQESSSLSLRTRKRGLLNCYSQVEAPVKRVQKFRVIEKEGSGLLSENRSPYPEKVDTIADHRDMLGETHIHTSFNNRTVRFTEAHEEREKPSGADGCSHAISLEPNDVDSVACSVASCSISSNNSFKLPCNFSKVPIENAESNFSDAESVYRWDYEEGNCLPPTQEELAAEIHSLELHAYRCTMEALHALGPLSWEQEALVTNLRLSLHISNDEHLMELRNLVSTATSMHVR